MEDITFKDLIDSGNKAQVEKLEDNKHKRGLGNSEIGFLFFRIGKKFVELRRELCDEIERYYEVNFFIKKHFQYKIIRGIAADIANYAHMIIVYCDNEIEKKGH